MRIINRIRRCADSQQRRAPVAPTSVVLVATLLIVATFCAPAMAGGGTWSNSAGGAWETGTNWSSNSQPTSLDNVDFTLANTYTVTLSGAGAASNIRVNGGTVTFDLGGNTITSGSGTLHVAALTTQVASLTLSNGTLIANGATDSNVGNGIGAVGRLTLNNATLTLAQTLSVGNNQGSGSLTLNAGSQLNSGSWTVIGYANGTSGSLLVQSGAKLVSNLSNLIGYGSGATGSATITGSNSSMTATSGIIDVGDGGTGTLLVDNNATASSGAFTLIGYSSGSGTMLIQNGGQVTAGDRGIIGWESTGYASVSGTNSKFIISSGYLDVGDNGQGTLQISSGGEVNVNGYGLIGYSSGNGRLIITGANSKFTVSGALDIGNGSTGSMTLLSSGAATINGTLKVFANGSLSLTSGAALTVGTLDLGGSASRFNWTGGTLRITNSLPSADGALTVPDTATLAGSGTVGRATTVAPGGTLAPGASAGKLTFTDSLTLQTSGPTHASFDVELSGTPSDANAGVTYDQVVVSGSGKVFNVGGATLHVIPINSVTLNQPYQIVKVTGGATVNFSSMFSNLTGGTHYANGNIVYDVSYDTNVGISVTFTTVPEPGCATLLATIALCAISRRRRGS